MQGKKRAIIGIFAIIIITFGIIGCVPSFAGIYFVKNFNIDNVNSVEMLASFGNSMDSVTGLIKDSSTTLKNAAKTVQDAKDSLSDASELLKESSTALIEISKLVDFEILGIKPMQGVSQYFISIAVDLGSLSESVETMSESIGGNAGDITKISQSLGEVSMQLDTFTSSFLKSSETVPQFGLKSILYFVLIYMGILNIIFIIIGISLLSLNRM